MSAQTAKKLPSREQLAELSKKALSHYEPMRETLEKEHWGEYITIHPETGDHAISAEHRIAVEEMRLKFPGILFYTIRIGYRAFGHFGGRGASDGRRP